MNKRLCYVIYSFIILFFLNGCRTPQKSTSVVTPPPPPKPVEKPHDPVPPEVPQRLNIALLLPLDLQKNLLYDTSMTVDESSITSLGHLNFYEGFQIAADSLRKSGKEINISTFDASVDSNSFINLLYRKEVLASDYIVCATNANYLGAASKIAAKHNNKIVFIQSPMQNTIVKENKNAWLAAPSNYTQSSRMAAYLAANYSASSVTILFRSNAREKMWATYFHDELKKGGINTIKMFIYTKALQDTLAAELSKNKKNLVIIPSSDEAFVSPVLSSINSLALPELTVAGLPTWENFESIDFSMLSGINTLYFTTSFVNEDDYAVKNFRRLFFKHYHSLPMQQAITGFDIAAYIAGLHLKTGNSIKPVLQYNFVQPVQDAGFENSQISVIGISDYKLVKKN